MTGPGAAIEVRGPNAEERASQSVIGEAQNSIEQPRSDGEKSGRSYGDISSGGSDDGGANRGGSGDETSICSDDGDAAD
ncbi:unnamed protein product [Eruca vesicaria subsp. sativa]|uniref:Uncharacterized protein n=1 Tax=Eruca vesicaria subsp. sativa TaxID=29727 RepID=A0ABC8L696_ERUVS|nr:unnamed protein product [Eruca vesicaria subsp. sativa]